MAKHEPVLLGMKTSSNRFSSFLIVSSVLALSTGVALYTYWRPRFERRLKVMKSLQSYKQDHQYNIQQNLRLIFAKQHSNTTTESATVSPSPVPPPQQPEQVYGNNRGQWVLSNSLMGFKTWNGRTMAVARPYTHTRHCYPMVNWHGEAITVCNTPQRTYAVTDEATKRTQEHVAVPFLGAQSERCTLVQTPPH